MSTFTALQIIDQARTYVDRDGTDDGVTNAQLLPLLSSKYFNLRRRLGDVVPDLFTGVETFSIASVGTSHTVVATDFGKVLKLERAVPGGYVPIQVAPLLTAETVRGLWRYRLRGDAIDVYPSSDAAGSYKLTYITKPTANITDVTDELEIPDAADDLLARQLAADILFRIRLDPTLQLQLADVAWRELVENLIDQYRATPQQIAEVY